MTKIPTIEINFLPPYNAKILENLDTLKLLTEDYALSLSKLLLKYKQLKRVDRPIALVNPFHGANVLLDSYFALLKDFLTDRTQQKYDYEQIHKCKKSFKLVFFSCGYLRSNSNEEIVTSVNRALSRLFCISSQELIKQNHTNEEFNYYG